MKKLAFLTATFPCLTETFVLREWEYLNKFSDVDIEIISIRKPHAYSLIDMPNHLDAAVTYLRPNCFLRIFLNSLFFPLMYPCRAAKILSLLLKELWVQPRRKTGSIIFRVISGIYVGLYLKRKGFDVIHAHFSSASSIALFAHLVSNIPFSYTIYANDDLFSAPVEFFDNKIQHCKTVVTDTEYNQRMINLLTEFQYEEKIEVIYTGLNIDQFSRCQPKHSFSAPLRILSVGSMSGFKGYPSVLEALSLLTAEGLNFEYRIVGGGDDTLVRKLIAKFGLEEKVKLVGAKPFEETRKEFEWCDLFIMASEINSGGRRDGFPTVIAEAMLMQRLVLATYISDIPNQVIHKETGLIVAEKNPIQLSNMIKFVLSQPFDCKVMVETAHKMALRKFDADNNYSRLKELLCRNA